MENATLEVRDLVKHYAAVRAVDGVSFTVQPGEIFALLGPNGAGKTTLVRMLLGIILPDTGSVDWQLGGAAGGRDPRRLGYLPEERGLHKDVPILRSLIYFGMLRGMTKADARSAASDWLERLELSDRASDKLDTLSKGNQQKIQFAAAVLHRPAVAVLDEPFSGLDPVNQERFLDHLQRMRDEGTTILLSAHQMALVERVADRLLLIDRGKAVLTGTLDEIRERALVGRSVLLTLDGTPEEGALAGCPGVISVEDLEEGRFRLQLTDDGPLNELLAELARRVTVREIHDERRTLHDVYVEAVRSSAAGTEGAA